MYHEEKVINGILCWRGTPNRDWEQYSLEAITVALTSERSRSAMLDDLALKASDKLEKVRIAM